MIAKSVIFVWPKFHLEVGPLEANVLYHFLSSSFSLFFVPVIHWNVVYIHVGPVFGDNVQYPRYLESEENNIHGPDYLIGTLL